MAPFDKAAVPPGGNALTVADWRTAMADAVARLAASERRMTEAIEDLARRVDTLEGEVARLHHGRDDGRIRALERRLAELSARIQPLEDRAISRSRR